MVMSSMTVRAPLIEHIWPAKSLTRDAVLILGTSLFLALSAQIAVPLPFSPVPVTTQTLVVLLAGAILGSRLGALSVMVYLAEGMVGLPFFAKGNAGFAYFRGVTGGYLVGFVLAAFIVGLLVERGFGRNVSTTVLAMLLGNLVLYSTGVLWLQAVLHSSLSKAYSLGVVPFMLGDLYKLGVGSVLLPGLWKFFGKPADY
jgi:biotin transport system substrate-specific component